MNLSKKRLNLLIIGIMLLVVVIGCTPKDDEPLTDVVLKQNVGFNSAMTTEDGKDYVDFILNGESTKLQVKDKEIFNTLEIDEFYIFTYTEEGALKSIRKDSFLKDLVENSTKDNDEQDEDNNNGIETEEIAAVDKVSLEGLTLLNEYIIDFNKDGNENKISMYTSAEKAENGEIMWDDGQRWLFVVQGNDEDYVLFDDYVQLGTIDFHVFTIEEDFYITTMHSGTANLTFTEFKFDPQKDVFVKSVPYGTTGNVNKLHSSYGY